MRTTLTIEPDAAARLIELAHKRRASFESTLNDVLRKGLEAPNDVPRPPLFLVEPHSGGFRPGVDPGNLNHLVDELEAEDFVDEASSRPR